MWCGIAAAGLIVLFVRVFRQDNILDGARPVASTKDWVQWSWIDAEHVLVFRALPRFALSAEKLDLRTGKVEKLTQLTAALTTMPRPYLLVSPNGRYVLVTSPVFRVKFPVVDTVTGRVVTICPGFPMYWMPDSTGWIAEEERSPRKIRYVVTHLNGMRAPLRSDIDLVHLGITLGMARSDIYRSARSAESQMEYLSIDETNVTTGAKRLIDIKKPLEDEVAAATMSTDGMWIAMQMHPRPAAENSPSFINRLRGTFGMREQDTLYLCNANGSGLRSIGSVDVERSYVPGMSGTRTSSLSDFHLSTDGGALLFVYRGNRYLKPLRTNR